MLRAYEEEFLANAERAGAPVAVLDIPLLFETKGEGRVDAVLVVSAPEEVQRQRILSRPNMTTAKLETILARQMSDADKRTRADFVVDTSKGLDAAREQIRHVLAKVATMPQRRS
jgi:dephospho-CoA kinase